MNLKIMSKSRLTKETVIFRPPEMDDIINVIV